LNFTIFETEFKAFETGAQVKPYPMFKTGPKGYSQLDQYLMKAYQHPNAWQFDPALFPQE
jgi:hypothetical protein